MTLACLRLRHQRWFLTGALALLFLLTVAAGPSAAQGENQSCVGCHKNPGLGVELASGEFLPLTLDPAVFQASVHGKAGLTCISCHTNISGYPHPKLTAGDRRSFQLERYTQCQSCHQAQYNQTLDSNHARALAGGNGEAAICTECHGAHDVAAPHEARQKISVTCQK